MWKKAGNWKFYCNCDWTVLEEEGKKDQSASNPVTVWYSHMKQQYGANVAKWPAIGCGARHFPWTKGMSM
eukprot:5640598-Prorocentrum_lima.AAC.1